MNDFFFFNPDNNKLVDTVTISAEHGMKGIINALSRLSLYHGGILQGKLNSGELNPIQGLHQISVPDPVIDYTLQPDGSYTVKVLEGSIDGPIPSSDAPPKRSSSLLIDYLRQYSVNGSH